MSVEKSIREGEKTTRVKHGLIQAKRLRYKRNIKTSYTYI